MSSTTMRLLQKWGKNEELCGRMLERVVLKDNARALWYCWACSASCIDPVEHITEARQLHLMMFTVSAIYEHVIAELDVEIQGPYTLAPRHSSEADSVSHQLRMEVLRGDRFSAHFRFNIEPQKAVFEDDAACVLRGKQHLEGGGELVEGTLHLEAK